MPAADPEKSMTVLEVADVERSAAFYRDKLGFTYNRIWGEPPAFCMVHRGGVSIALDQTRETGRVLPLNQYWAVYVYVADADAMHDEFRGRGVEIARGPEDMPYGCRDFDIRDPDGHLICFGTDLGD